MPAGEEVNYIIQDFSRNSREGGKIEFGGGQGYSATCEVVKEQKILGGKIAVRGEKTLSVYFIGGSTV